MKENENYKMLVLKAFMALMPENFDRKMTIERYAAIKDYFDLIHDDYDSQPLPISVLLSTYVDKPREMREGGWEKKTKKLGPTWGEALPLQWADYSKTLKNILVTKYFFRRFSKK